MRKKGVSAIVCAYNEGPRISKVLEILTKAENISEIIVVDDGSTDNTLEKARKFRNIRIFKNKKNKGKGYSMNLGVRKAKNKIIFFCDADLKGINSKMVDEIINPVLKGSADMSIGLRKRLSYNFIIKNKKLFLPFIISGERALKKALWYKVPKYYKEGYKIETGLNYYAIKNKYNVVSEQFDYMITIKEKKYDLLKALKQRVRLFEHLILAHIRYNLFDRW